MDILGDEDTVSKSVSVLSKKKVYGFIRFVKQKTNNLKTQ